MNILKLSFKNLINRPLNLVLCILLLALSTGIISIIGHSERMIKKQYLSQLKKIDLVVGAKGSPIQLILSAVFHIDNPTGNIPIHEAQKLSENPQVDFAVPMAYGDNYKGYHILGTTSEYLEVYEGKLQEGQLWKKPFEVVLGYQVAEKYQLRMGDEIIGSHGLSNEGTEHDEEPYKIVGILNPTSSVLDRLITTSLESVWHAHHEGEQEAQGHEEHHHEDHHHEDRHNHQGHLKDVMDNWLEIDEEQDITALLIKTKSPLGLIQLPRYVNKNTNMQAASPLYEMNRLSKLLGNAFIVLEVIAYIIMLVAGISIFISLYNKLKEKRIELAFMRLNGAKRWHLVSLLIYEAIFLSIIGFIIGIVLSKMCLIILAYSYSLNLTLKEIITVFSIYDIYLLLMSILIGLVAATIPAIDAFSLNISKTLRHE